MVRGHDMIMGNLGRTKTRITLYNKIGYLNKHEYKNLRLQEVERNRTNYGLVEALVNFACTNNASDV